MHVGLTKLRTAVFVGSAILVAALTVLLFFQDPDCFQFSDLLSGILRGFEELVEMAVAPVAIVLDAIVLLIDLPPPRDDWKEIFIVSFFLQIRSAQIDWSFHGRRRIVGAASLLVTFLVAVSVSYAIGVLAKEARPLAVAASIALLVLLLQASANLLASILRRPEDKSFASDFRFRQGYYTLGYTSAAISAVAATAYLTAWIGSFSLGLYATVLYLFFAAYLFFLEVFLQIRNWFRSYDQEPFLSTRITTALLLAASVAVAAGLLLLEGWLQGRVLAAFVC